LRITQGRPDNKRRIGKNINQNNSLGAILFSPTAQAWQRQTAHGVLSGVGSAALLSAPLLGFFASRQCPGNAIRAAMGWAVTQARAGQGVVSGFHSPLEQSVLKVYLVAQAPAVLVLARPVERARLPAKWKAAVVAGHLVVLSAMPDVATAAPRLTEAGARDRNEVVARLAARIVIAYAVSGGRLAGQATDWHSAGHTLQWL